MAVATGLDIGHQTVRALVVEGGSRELRILASGSVPRLDAEGQPRPVAAVVAELDTIVDFRGPVVVADNDINVLVRFVSTLALPADRLARLLRLELEQHADSSGDLAADTLPVPIAGDELLHCCILAQPAQVYSTLIDLREAKAGSAIIHFAPAAVYNSTTLLPPVMDSDLAVVIDIGAKVTGITLFGDDRLLACRQVSVGGDLFTEALVANGIDPLNAEAAKRRSVGGAASASSPSDPFGSMLEEGLRPGSAGAAEVPIDSLGLDAAPAQVHPTSELFVVEDEAPLAHAGPAGEAPVAPAVAGPETPPVPAAGVPHAGAGTPPGSPAAAPSPASTGILADAALDPALTKAADVLFGHIVASLTWFKTQLKVRSIEPKVILLSGGGAATPGLAGYLSRRLSYQVRIHNPFEAIEQGRKPDHAHEWATALGLAISAPVLHRRAVVRLDLRPEGLIKRELWRTRLAWPYVAAGLLVVASVFALLAMHAQYAAEQDCLETFATYDKAYDEQNAQLVQAQQQHDGLSSDLRSIAARIYGGSTLLSVLRSLKEETKVKEFQEIWITKLATHAIGQEGHIAKEQEARGNKTSKLEQGENTIDRGEVDIYGLIKTSDTHSIHERVGILGNWSSALKTWSPDDGHSMLFSDGQSIEISDRAGIEQSKSQSQFGYRFIFSPTDLSLLTAPALAPDRH